MSSIYDALQRIQSQKAPVMLDVLRQEYFSRRKIFLVVVFSIIISSVGTAGIFYGVWTLKDGNGGTKIAGEPKGSPETTVAEPLVQQVDPYLEDEDLLDDVRDDVKGAGTAPETVEAYLTRGGRYYESGEYDRALLTYEEALEYFKDDARILNNIGSVLLARGELERALEHFFLSNSANRNFVEPMYNMACAYAMKNDQAQAILALKKAYILNPDVKQWAAEDPDLETLRGNRDFDEIIHGQ